MRFSLLPGFEYGRSIMLYALGNHRAHGFALLVVFLALPGFAQWSASDSYHLNQIYFQLGGDYNSSHSIHSDLTQVLSLQRGTFNVSSNTYELLDEFYDAFRDVLNPDLQGGYSSVKVDFFLDGYTPYVHRDLPYDPRISAELLVTNRAETYWLEKIYNAIVYGGGAGGYSIVSPLGALYNDFFASIDNLKEILEVGSPEFFHEAFQYYGLFLENPVLMLSLLDWESLPSDQAIKLNLAWANMLGFTPFLAGFDIEETGKAFNSQYGTYLLTSNSLAQSAYIVNNGGLSANVFTNLYTADGSLENPDNSFTNSSSVFNKFATSFLPSSLFNPEQVNTNLFEYVDANISGTPIFNPQPLQGGTRSRSSDSFDYDFEDSRVYDYNLVNPLKTATDVVQGDTDIDNKFQTLADLVNQRISSIFDTPLNNISQQPSRWSVKFRDKDGATLEEYVASQQAETADGISFACWVLESTMFAGFFFLCVRRSLRIGTAGDPPT